MCKPLNTAQNQGTEELPDDVGAIYAQLDQLDREWSQDRERYRSVPKLRRRQLLATASMRVGFSLVCLGLWLDELGIDDVRIERLLFPWPIVLIVVGVLLILGWIVFYLMTGHHRNTIEMYKLAEQSYGYRRYRLLERLELTNDQTDK
ncbi:MAG: hypothetical protein ACQESR_25325 [Planctomycetota bacterium]